eukprot:TRINITY_DN112900_c0_g1_i1.p2 TRINITY_DN112900_c0_g1~~TRINITY_DN112900_c0_g1_i1.p2  ORF type:complete len:144 (+),score=37.29 TRINITY_DN112900_c0_g1_i1:1-432(+)
MLEDVVPVGKISPLKAPLAEVQGLAVVTESEEEKLFSQGKDGSRKGSTASGNQEEEKVMMRKKASNKADEEEKDIKVDLPMLVRTASIPTKMAALSVFWSLSETRIEAQQQQRTEVAEEAEVSLQAGKESVREGRGECEGHCL